MMQLRIPGPTPLPDEVLEAMNRNMISHRGAEFRALMRDVTERLKFCFQTEGDVLVFPGAGTGGLEAPSSISSRPGDTVLAAHGGRVRRPLCRDRGALRPGCRAGGIAVGRGGRPGCAGASPGSNAGCQRRADDPQRDLHRRAKRRGEGGAHPPKHGATRLLCCW